MTTELLAFLKDLQHVLKKHSGSLIYTKNDDGIHAYVGKAWQNGVCIGFPDDIDYAGLDKVIADNTPETIATHVICSECGHRYALTTGRFVASTKPGYVHYHGHCDFCGHQAWSIPLALRPATRAEIEEGIPDQE